MSDDSVTSPLLRTLRVLGGDSNQGAHASNAHYFGLEEMSLWKSSPRRYSLLCHDTKTRVVVGGEGVNEADMIPSLLSDGAMDAFCAFLMHNRQRALYLHAEPSADPAGYDDYYEFSAWAHEPPPA